ncbi:MAG: hypothetical protein E7409_03420 [Ruminococcaceae bacterium]|nr:hypothetical protein [Oscillospiraceae bacterium]
MKYKGKDFNMWDAWFLNVDGRVHALHLKGNEDLTKIGTKWSLGHVYTDDLLHFQRCEDVLPPLDETRFPEDCQGKFTGCAITEQESGEHYIYYTMRNKIESEKIGLAVTQDMENFKVYHQNPVLTPDPDVFCVPPADRKTDCRDMLVVHDSKTDRYYGYFATMANNSDGVPVGVIGVAESEDLLCWNNQKIAYMPPFCGVVEVPDVYCMDGKWYMTFLTGNGYGAKGAITDGNLANYTLYAVSDCPQGPFEMQSDNIFIGGPYESGYTCRTFLYNGKRYVMYIERSCYGAAISLPKEVRVIDGVLRLCYTPLLEKIRTGNLTGHITSDMLIPCKSSFGWDTKRKENIECKDGALIIRGGAYDYSHYMIDEATYGSVEVEFGLVCDCREGGIMLKVKDETDEALAYFITADTQEQCLCISKTELLMCKQFIPHAKRKYPFEKGKEYAFRVIAMEGQFEIYIDDILVLQGNMQTGQGMTAGVVCGCGDLKVINPVVYELER